MGLSQTLKRKEKEDRKAGILLILPFPCLWQTSLIKLKVSGRHY